MIASPAALFEAPDLDMAQFQANLRALRASRAAGRPGAMMPATDAARLAAAFRDNATVLVMRVPTQRAPNTGPCPRCNTRGTVGCRHFLPFKRDA